MLIAMLMLATASAQGTCDDDWSEVRIWVEPNAGGDLVLVAADCVVIAGRLICNGLNPSVLTSTCGLDDDPADLLIGTPFANQVDVVDIELVAVNDWLDGVGDQELSNDGVTVYKNFERVQGSWLRSWITIPE
jgi:hypothetical protein